MRSSGFGGPTSTDALDHRHPLHRIRYGNTTATSTPKTARGNRTIALGPATLSALRAWKRTQTAERLQVGGGWQGEHGLVATNIDGAAPNPEALSDRSPSWLERRSCLRSGCTISATATPPPHWPPASRVKVLSQRIGHADVGVTRAVSAHVMPGDDENAARRADAHFTEP